MKHDDDPQQRSLAIFGLVFLVLVVSIGVTDYGFYRAFAAHVQAQVEGQLDAIAAMRIAGLSDWRNERLMAEAEILRRNTHFAEEVQRSFADPRDLSAQGKLQATMQSYRAHREYAAVSLLDRAGQTRLSDSGAVATLAPLVLAHIPDVVRTRQVTLVDFYQGGADQRSELTVLIPIIDPQPDQDVIGLVALQIDPEVYLYPSLLQSPISSASAETILARREGDRLVALSPLRFDPEAALRVSSPLTAPALSTVAAAAAQASVIAGRDYRGEAVAAAVRAVPDSPWLLITKIDTAEAYAPLQERVWQLMVFSGVLISALGAGLLLLRRQQHLSAMRQQLTIIAALRTSEARYRTLVDSLDVSLTERKHAQELVAAQRDLARIGSTVSADQDAWPRVLAIALQVSGLDCGGLYLFDADDGALRLVHHQGLGEAFVQATAHYAPEAPNVRMVLAGTSVYLSADDTSQHEVLRREGLTAGAIIPIHHQGQMLGTINVASHTLAQVAPAARAALETISAEIGNLVVYLRTEAALREREQQARSLVASLNAEQLRFTTVATTVPGAICTFRLRPDGLLCIPYASKAFEDVFGLSPDAVAEQIDPLTARVSPEHVAHLVEAVAESARTLQPWRNEYPYRHPLKGEIWIEGYAMPVREEDGTTIWHGISTDITARKRAEEQLRQSEVRFRALIEHAPGAITLLGTDGRLKFISASTERVMGYRPDEQLGSDPTGLTHPDDLPALLGLLSELMATPAQVRVTQYRFRHRDGSWRWVESTISNLLHEPSVNAIAFNFQDITQRKQADLALRASEEQYRGLMESLDNVVATVDAAGTFLYINSVGARVVGLPAEAVIGKTIADLFPERIAAEQLQHVQRVLRDDSALVYETLGVLQGQPRWYRNAVQPIHDETGRASAALINATDIHDLKTAQQELQELNQTLEERVRERTAEVQDLYERAPTGYHSLDAEGNLIMVNQTELDWLGYTRDELVGRPLVGLFTPASRALFHTLFPRFKEQGWLQGVELELIRKDGSTFPVLVSATAVYDDAGAYALSRSTIFDITERKAAEAALRESEAQNRLLFEESPDALVLFDAAGGVVRMNHAFARMTGYHSEQLAGRRLEARGLLSDRDSAQFAAALEQARQSNTSTATTFQLMSADGETRDVGARVFGLQIQGAPHCLTALRDVTAEMRAAATLRRANAELARAARAKDEFLANMSHELRTPLNAILGFSESLLEEVQGPLTARQQVALRYVEASGQHLLALINDILDLSKVGAGRLELQREAVSVVEACQSSLLFVKEVAQKKALRLALHVQDQLVAVEADPRRLKQMLVNLLSNAVKFTPDGGTVRLEVVADAEAGSIRFAVQDTGIGIAPEDLGRLFKPFSQLDSSLRRQHEGTGLGLALVQRLAELHGGSVTVESELGTGSRFTIALPYRPPRSLDAPPALGDLGAARDPGDEPGARRA